MRHAWKLAVTVDVEEEGLFVGRFPRQAAGVANVPFLRRVAFISQEFGFPLTLLITYQVARDAAARRVLADFRDRLAAEIGAHLHPWNTPPFLPQPESLRSEDLPRSLLADKLNTLLSALTQGFGRPPTSFRMGRFDWGPKVLSLLPRFGLRVDSSMVPLTQVIGGPDHFLVPRDPFWVGATGDRASLFLEAPLTLAPYLPATPPAVYRLSARAPGRLGHLLRAWFPFVMSAGIQPVWFPLPWMRLGTRLHQRQGGRVLTLLFHSSELMPGGTPHHATERAVARLVRKLCAYLTWLVREYEVEGVTLGELAAANPAPHPGAPAWLLSAGD